MQSVRNLLSFEWSTTETIKFLKIQFTQSNLQFKTQCLLAFSLETCLSITTIAPSTAISTAYSMSEAAKHCQHTKGDCV